LKEGSEEKAGVSQFSVQPARQPNLEHNHTRTILFSRA
jgi:hypothetical protein